jgi:hypothetical protein
MIISKKKLLSLIKQNLTEMPMTFDGEDRPHQSVQQKLSTGDTPLKQVPFPNTGNPNQNFQELLASERYREVVAKVREFTNFRGNIQDASLTGIMMEALNTTTRIESQYKRELEQLAIQIVLKEYSVPENKINITATITGGISSTEGMQQQRGPEINEPEVDIDSDDNEDGEQQPQQPQDNDFINDEKLLAKALQDLSLEKAKRRLSNALIQGAAKEGHWLHTGSVKTGEGELDFTRVSTLIKQIVGNTNGEELIRCYGLMMSINDSLYWQMSNDQIKNLSSSVAGRVQVIFQSPESDVDNQEQPDMDGGEDDDEEGGGEDDNRVKIIAQGINFVVLVHELTKGIFEVLSGAGIPDDQETWNKIDETEEILQKEMWDLRLGPAIWNRLKSQIPDKYSEEDSKSIKNFLLSEIFGLPAKQFLIFLREVISGSQKGSQLIQKVIDSIVKDLNDEEYEEAMSQFDNELDILSDETDNDDLKNFITGIPGISLSNDDDDFDDFLNNFGIRKPD